MRPIVALTGLTLRTARLDAMADFYGEAFGLTTTRQEPFISLSGRLGSAPHLILESSDDRGLSELRFAMRAKEEVDAFAADLVGAGISLIGGPEDDGSGYGFSIRDPDETRLNFRALGHFAADTPADNDRPLYLSHVVINSPNPARLIAFYTELLGFTVSDAYEKGLLTFLRCDQPQHHCLGISPAESSGLNHFAMDCGNLDALMRSIARMERQGHLPIWGPGRHGPGGNIFCYFEDPDGFVPEFTCDVLQISDPSSWRPTEWERTPANANVWGTGGPTPRAIALMSGTALPARQSADN